MQQRCIWLPPCSSPHEHPPRFTLPYLKVVSNLPSLQTSSYVFSVGPCETLGNTPGVRLQVSACFMFLGCCRQLSRVALSAFQQAYSRVGLFLELPSFLIAHLLDVNWHHLVLIHNSLIANEFEHLFSTRLLLFSPSLTCLFMSFAHFPI